MQPVFCVFSSPEVVVTTTDTQRPVQLLPVGPLSQTTSKAPIPWADPRWRDGLQKRALRVSRDARKSRTTDSGPPNEARIGPTGPQAETLGIARNPGRWAGPAGRGSAGVRESVPRAHRHQSKATLPARYHVPDCARWDGRALREMNQALLCPTPWGRGAVADPARTHDRRSGKRSERTARSSTPARPDVTERTEPSTDRETPAAQKPGGTAGETAETVRLHPWTRIREALQAGSGGVEQLPNHASPPPDSRPRPRTPSGR